MLFPLQRTQSQRGEWSQSMYRRVGIQPLSNLKLTFIFHSIHQGKSQEPMGHIKECIFHSEGMRKPWQAFKHR
jgi:hypothetical protein